MNHLFKFLIILLLLILFYILYKLTIALDTTSLFYYLPYLVTTIILLGLALILNNYFEELKAYFVIIFFSFMVGLYFIELHLIKLYKPDFRIKQKVELYKKKSNKDYDLRSLDQVYDEEKIKNNNVTIEYSPSNFISKETKIFPVSGKSNALTIMNCNENGYRPIYKSDRYGFNNPDYEWDKDEIEYLIIGDSSTLGNCVNRPDDIGSNLRNLSNKSSINLGQGGNGPLIGLASLKEYIQPNIKNIIWLFFEGNDLLDLEIELESSILRSYLNTVDFKQNLKKKQKEINNLIELNLQKDLKKRKIKREKKKFNIIEFIKLNHTRNFIYNFKFLKNYNNKAFNYKKEIFSKDQLNSTSLEKILSLANNLAINNNSNFYFVNLPNYTRYSGNVERNSLYLRELVESLNIKFIDIHEEVFLKEKDPLDLFPFRLPGHYNAKGYKKISQAIYSYTMAK